MSDRPSRLQNLPQVHRLPGAVGRRVRHMLRQARICSRNLLQISKLPDGRRAWQMFTQAQRDMERALRQSNQLALVDATSMVLNPCNKQIYVGPEHPRLEMFVIALSRLTGASNILEVGYLCGGLMFPVVQHLARRGSNWRYVGIDLEAELGAEGELYYASELIPQVLETSGVDFRDNLFFLIGDAEEVIRTRLKEIASDEFDLIIIDHAKPLYPSCYRALLDLGYVGARTPVVFHDIFSYAKHEWSYLRQEYRSQLCFEMAAPHGDIGVILGTKVNA